MITDIVVLLEQPDRDAFIQFIDEIGGCWTRSSVSGNEYGVLEKGGAAVLLYMSIMSKQVDYDESEIDELRKCLGKEPGIIITLSIRRNERSISLAHEIEERIVARWGGYIDRE